MAEEIFEAKTYEIDYRCDVCGKGHYRYIGEALTVHPMIYRHKCSNCGAIAEFNQVYPYEITRRMKN